MWGAKIVVWIVLALALFIFQIATVLLIEFRRPTYAVAWLFILFVIPVAGFVLYFLMAKEYSRRRKIRRRSRLQADASIVRNWMEGEGVSEEATEDEPVEIVDGSAAFGWPASQKRLYGLLSRIPDAPITFGNKADILTDARATYAAIRESLELARNHIHLEYYIIRQDRTGFLFQQLLIKKAREGVKVRLIYDGLGSLELGKKYLQALRDAGVEVYSFLPLLISLYQRRINYRNHRKAVIIDGKIGFLGGINVGNEYLGEDPALGFWRDTHIRLEGESVVHLQRMFVRDWRFVSGERLAEEGFFQAQQGDRDAKTGHEPEGEWGKSGLTMQEEREKRRGVRMERGKSDRNRQGDQRVQILVSGPNERWKSIQQVYFAVINAAVHRVYLTTPYFIPDPSILMAIKTAALSGVDVRIILPDKVDYRMVKWASLSFVEDLLDVGVRIFEYKKGFMHAKVFIVDHFLASVGTANLDMRSFYNNFELNALLFDPEAIGRLESDFLRDLGNSVEIDQEEFERRSRLKKAQEVVGRLLSPLF
ncbi:MAG: phospholipase D/transphosphatidylase [Paenibacillaceae bacterium]|nr:phospholipase D/transphosphatidylase [Paenibacillaceae bacterium]